MPHIFSHSSSIRIFAVSTLVSIGALVFVANILGAQAALATLALIVIEMTFSFDNAIINARILAHMSPFWRQMFMTVGIVIAVFGMRIIFPIGVVVLGAGLSWGEVIDLALHRPAEYAAKLAVAHPSIAAFGGAFLLMLALDFFMDRSREVRWLVKFEAVMQKVGHAWMPAVVAFAVVGGLTLVPFNHHSADTFKAGVFGIMLYVAIKFLTGLFGGGRAATTAMKTGMAGLTAFLYLEVLDASFSLDGVIGAFAITDNVILIAIGLGVGALWVRSFTLFMVKKRTLHSYQYLEHGAHYTILLLSLLLFAGLFVHIPEAVAGVMGVVIIALSIIASKRQS